MLTEEALLVAGWRKYAPPAVGFGAYADEMYQLRIKDDDGKTLFFVQLYRCDRGRLVGDGGHDRWSAEAVLHQAGLGEDGLGFVTLQLNGCERLTPDEVVRFYRDAYDRIGCVPGRHNQG